MSARSALYKQEVPCSFTIDGPYESRVPGEGRDICWKGVLELDHTLGRTRSAHDSLNHNHEGQIVYDGSKSVRSYFERCNRNDLVDQPLWRCCGVLSTVTVLTPVKPWAEGLPRR